ncbi:DUF4153 domain-containing protein [Streptomyces sp. NPDC058674]|uniref:DUF4153 domain-containing protein n=1 Tax=Streptomyces sp. NPDC058674 TaxID=3346592 RepID=UPI00364D6817
MTDTTDGADGVEAAGGAAGRGGDAPSAAPVPPVPGPGPGGPPGTPADAAAWQAWQAHQRRERERTAAAARTKAAAPPAWAELVRPAEAAPVRTATLVAALVAGLAAALLLGDGLGVGLLLAVLPAAVAAYAAARTALRTARPWSTAWAVGCLALLAVPALRDSAWPSTLAILCAVLLGALALHGSRTWPGILLSPIGFLEAAVSGLGWAREGLRSRSGISKDRWLPVARAAAVALGLLLLFGALFASADAAFADLLSGLAPDVSVGDGPVRGLLFLLGAVLALAAARVAAAPLRWDRITVAPGKCGRRGRRGGGPPPATWAGLPRSGQRSPVRPSGDTGGLASQCWACKATPSRSSNPCTGRLPDFPDPVTGTDMHPASTGPR